MLMDETGNSLQALLQVLRNKLEGNVIWEWPVFNWMKLIPNNLITRRFKHKKTQKNTQHENCTKTNK